MGAKIKIILAVVGAALVAGAALYFFFFYRVATSVSSYPQGSIPKTYSFAPGERLYLSRIFGFSLRYPEELTVKEWGEADTSTITFESPSGDKGFQLFVVPYDEPTVSEKRFKMDIPSGVYQEPITVMVDGVEATAFFSVDLVLGETREVWFIHDGLLFEVTAHRALDAWLAQVMQGWEFIE